MGAGSRVAGAVGGDVGVTLGGDSGVEVTLGTGVAELVGVGGAMGVGGGVPVGGQRPDTVMAWLGNGSSRLWFWTSTTLLLPPICHSPSATGLAR